MTEFNNNLYQFPTGGQPVIGQDYSVAADVISLSGSRVQFAPDIYTPIADVVPFSKYSGYPDVEPISDPIEAKRLAAVFYADSLDTEPSGAETPFDQDALEGLIDDNPDALVGPFVFPPSQEQCDTSICIRGILAAVLTPEQRNLLELSYLDELSPEQIARSHNMTVSEITNILNNAMAMVGKEAIKRGLLLESL
jgi:DNA-binding CsgD family transcriptional regulator